MRRSHTFKDSASGISSARFTLLLAVVLVVFYNLPLWSAVLAPFPLNASNAPFLLSFFVFLVAFLSLFLALTAFRYVQKPIAILILMTAAPATYFMSSYGVMLDQTMIQNVMETHSAEAFELFNWQMAMYFVVLGIVPSLLVYKTPVRYRPWHGELKLLAGSLALSLVAIVAVGALFYQDYASLFRNNRHLRHLATPTNYLNATAQYLGRSYRTETREIVPIGTDATRGELWAAKTRRTVMVIVVGETARAQNFSLGGYARPTNAYLSREAIINFSDTSSCGTSTAISVPCMFSHLAREDYDDTEAKTHEGLLDILARSGLRVLWRENNSGCKGACDRVETQTVAQFRSPEHCDGEQCFDEVLLNGLDEYLAASDQDAVIVLHQLGSHGPAYYRRYPKQFERFTPVCASSQLQDCTEQEIVNTYDNTILYTDYFLSRVIDFLKQRSDRYDSAMIYMSDHGESLGEHNLYLHGLPYFVAPDVQKKVPFIVWLSEGFSQSFAVDNACLRSRGGDPVSHDNLFHSVLGVLDVQTEVYKSELDVFAGCQQRTMVASKPSAQSQPEVALGTVSGDRSKTHDVGSPTDQGKL